MYLFSLGGKSIGEIFVNKNYWLSVGVANGLILIGYLMMYRVDAQNIALNENDLEDTEWLSVKRLKKLKEFQVYDYKSAEEKTDGIVIAAGEKLQLSAMGTLYNGYLQRSGHQIGPVTQQPAGLTQL